MASSNEVLPWSTWPMMVTTGHLGSHWGSPTDSRISSRRASPSFSPETSVVIPNPSAINTPASKFIGWFKVNGSPTSINFRTISAGRCPNNSAYSLTVMPGDSFTVFFRGLVTSVGAVGCACRTRSSLRRVGRERRSCHRAASSYFSAKRSASRGLPGFRAFRCFSSLLSMACSPSFFSGCIRVRSASETPGGWAKEGGDKACSWEGGGPITGGTTTISGPDGSSTTGGGSTSTDGGGVKGTEGTPSGTTSSPSGSGAKSSTSFLRFIRICLFSGFGGSLTTAEETSFLPFAPSRPFEPRAWGFFGSVASPVGFRLVLGGASSRLFAWP